MNETSQNVRPPIQTGQGLAHPAAVGPSTPETGLQNFLSRLQRQNSDLNEMIMLQRDSTLRITGANPIEEPPPMDAPEAVGTMAEINLALGYNLELIGKLRALTNHWASI